MFPHNFANFLSKLHQLFRILKILLSTIFYVNTFLEKMKVKNKKNEEENFQILYFLYHIVKRHISRLPNPSPFANMQVGIPQNDYS